MEGESDYQTHDDIVRNGDQPERMICFNCKQEVQENTVCSICGYPLSFSLAEHIETKDESDVDHEAMTIQLTSEDSYEGLDASSQQDIEVSKTTERILLRHEVSIEETNKKPKTGLEPGKSTSFFDGLRKFVGGKNTSQPENVKDPEIQASHWLDDMKQRQINGEASVTVNNDVETESIEVAADVVDEDYENNEVSVENPITEVCEVSDIVEVVPIQISEDSTSLANDIDPKLKEVQEGLLQSISLKLWLVNLLQEGGIDEEQFEKMFDKYNTQISDYLKTRDELLEQEKEIEFLKKSLSKAIVYFEELKMKREICKISEEEFRAKAPAFEWEINHYRNKISDCTKEVDFLEDLTRVMPKEDIIEIKAKMEKYRWDLDNQELSGNITAETTRRVKESLERTLDFLEKFKVNY